MKFFLFCLIVVLLADLCTAKDLFARERKRRAVSGANVVVDIRSEGCEDPGKAPNTCGLAYIRVNGNDHSPHGRGHNVVVLDGTTGNVVGTASFDTHGDSTAGTRLADYLNAINGDQIVLVAVQDEGSRFMQSATDALKRVGAVDPVVPDYRGSFALAGHAEALTNRRSWISQVIKNRGQGPSEISVTIPLSTPAPLSTSLGVNIRSEGCEDPGKAPNTCGLAYIRVNGNDHSPHGRGHNVVVVDGTTGSLLQTAAFDTHGDSTAGNRLRDYLNAINGDKIVLVAVQDEGSRFMQSASDALKRVGAVDPVVPDYRGSFALAGHAEVNSQSWISQVIKNRGQGPSEISVTIPLTQMDDDEDCQF